MFTFPQHTGSLPHVDNDMTCCRQHVFVLRVEPRLLLLMPCVS